MGHRAEAWSLQPPWFMAIPRTKNGSIERVDRAGPRPRRGESRDCIEHPRTRKDCATSPRPCLFVSCRYHLYLDVRSHGRSIRLNFPDKEVWELEETCALDVAESGGITLEEVGNLLGLTRERIRQIESDALRVIRGAIDDPVSKVEGEDDPPRS